MAKSFKEIGKKAETLIEQGREADQRIQACQASVASASSQVAAARRQLAAASETDEEGRPRGDVAYARAQLSMAENLLAASERALSAARGAAERVRQEKQSQVQVIERHNQVSRSNLEKLRRLRAEAFGADSVALAEGMAERVNEAENARVALLRSMGIGATPDHVTIGGVGGAEFGKSSSYGAIDTTGRLQSYQGGGTEGVASGGGVAAPVGGGLGALGGPMDPFSPGQSFGEDSSFPEGMYPPTSEISVEHEGSVGLLVRGRPRTPNEIMAAMKKAQQENWMNNFNADEWKFTEPEKLYKERLALYRKGVAALIGEERAAKLTDSDLEQISRVQNRAYMSGCQLTEDEIAELYRNAASNRQSSIVTRRIETKMDKVLQGRALALLQKPQYSEEPWSKADIAEKKETLKSLLQDMNSLFKTNVSPNIDFFYDEGSGTRGMYSRAANQMRINEYYLSNPVLLQTVIHEMRHAYQHHATECPRDVLVSHETIRVWKDNFDHYKSPRNGCTIVEYLAQPIEWDAKHFAGQDNEVLGVRPEYEGSWD